MGFHIRVLLFKPSWEGDIVRVHAGDVFAFCFPQADVQRLGDADIDRIPDQPDPLVLQTVQIVDRIVGGAVVDDQKLELPERLG